jgi:hypothetical protein
MNKPLLNKYNCDDHLYGSWFYSRRKVVYLINIINLVTISLIAQVINKIQIHIMKVIIALKDLSMIVFALIAQSMVKWQYFE